MRNAAMRQQTPAFSGHTAVRLLISSYFMALAIGLIPGTDIAILVRIFLPALAAQLLMGATVFALAVAVLVGVHRRAAALVLAIILFWASYITMLNGAASDIGAFWRDLALIGALILTYAETQHATRNEAWLMFSNFPHRRREVSDVLPLAAVPAPRHRRDTSKDQFRKDFDLARAH